MKAVIRDGKWYFTTQYVERNIYNDSAGNFIRGLEYNLFKVVYKKMNMTFELVNSPEVFEERSVSVKKLIGAMFEKEAYIALGGLGKKLFVFITY